MVLGHEPAGTVVETGAGVTGWSAGDRAALEPAIYCYHCEFCRSGQHNVCANIRFLSNPGIPGFFREHVNLPAANLLAIPRELPSKWPPLCEPLAVAMHSLKFAAVQLGETVAVFGAGPIGLLHYRLPQAGRRLPHLGRRTRGAPPRDGQTDGRQRWLSTPWRRRRPDSFTERPAAAAWIAPSTAPPRSTPPTRPSESARNGGRVVLTGIHSAAFVPFEVSPMRRKELAIFNVRRSNHESEAALELLVNQMDWFAPLVTHTRPLESIAEAFHLVEDYADGVGKLVVVSRQA